MQYECLTVTYYTEIMAEHIDRGHVRKNMLSYFLL